MKKETNPFLTEKNTKKKINENYEKEKTMKISIKEGAATTVMGSFGDAYITPYALSLNANNVQIGLLGSITGLIGPLAQIKGSKLMERFSRKKIVVVGVALQAIMWIPILILAFLFQKGMFLEYLPIVLIIFYSLMAIFSSIAGPAWFSLLGDIVPQKIRGKYFGKRNRVAGIVGLITTLGAAFLLDLFKTKGIVLLGFSLLFFVAFVFRLVSAYLFTKHYDPKLKLNDGYYFTFFDFLKEAPKNNFGRFTIYVALMYFGVQISGPFFAVYMLKDLNFNYVTYTLINLSSTVFALITMGIWGKFSDKFGNRKILAICGFIIPLIPILWIFSPSPIYLFLVPQLIGGIGWAGFNLAVSNFIYDAVTPARRAICVAYLNLMVGIGLFLGGIAGGFIAQFSTIRFMNIMLFIFLVSGVARLIVSLIFIPMIKEVKEVHKLRHPFVLLKQFEFILGGIFEIFNNLKIKKKSKKH